MYENSKNEHLRCRRKLCNKEKDVMVGSIDHAGKLVSDDEVIGLYAEVENIGVTLSASKTKYLWILEIKGRMHRIEFLHSKVSGKKKIFVNGNLIHESTIMRPSQFQYTWQIDSHLMSIIWMADSYFHLNINGLPFYNFSQKSHKVNKCSKSCSFDITNSSLSTLNASSVSSPCMNYALKNNLDESSNASKEIESKKYYSSKINGQTNKENDNSAFYNFFYDQNKSKINEQASSLSASLNSFSFLSQKANSSTENVITDSDLSKTINKKRNLNEKELCSSTNAFSFFDDNPNKFNEEDDKTKIESEELNIFDSLFNSTISKKEQTTLDLLQNLEFFMPQNVDKKNLRTDDRDFRNKCFDLIENNFSKNSFSHPMLSFPLSSAASSSSTFSQSLVSSSSAASSSSTFSQSLVSSSSTSSQSLVSSFVSASSTSTPVKNENVEVIWSIDDWMQNFKLS